MEDIIEVVVITMDIIMVITKVMDMIHPDTDPEELCPGNLKDQVIIIINQ